MTEEGWIRADAKETSWYQRENRQCLESLRVQMYMRAQQMAACQFYPMTYSCLVHFPQPVTPVKGRTHPFYRRGHKTCQEMCWVWHP